MYLHGLFLTDCLFLKIIYNKTSSLFVNPNTMSDLKRVEKYEYSPESAEAYAELPIEGTTYEMAFTAIRSLLEPLDGMAALDFGCGTGRSTRFLDDLGASNVTGVDHNHSMLEKARLISQDKGHIAYHLVEDGCTSLDDETIDIVLSTSAFIEMNSQQIRRALSEIFRVLKPGGKFVLSTANPEAFGRDYVSYSRITDAGTLRDGGKTVCRMKGDTPFDIVDIYWSEDTYRALLEEVGFTIQQVIFPKAEGEGWLDETEVAPEMVIECRKPSL